MISIYSPTISKRLVYIVDFIFNDLLQIDYVLTNKLDELGSVTINYSDSVLEFESYNIQPFSLLNEGSSLKPNISEVAGLLSICSTPLKNCDHGFDIFSATFYLISRMEEYDLKSLDNHNRFISENSILVQNQVNHLPIVDLWCINLINEINKKFKVNISSKREFNQYCTFDIDNAFAFKYKGLMRTFGAFCKDTCLLKKDKVTQRVRFYLGLSRDPYDSFKYISDFCEANKLKQLYFFLLGDYGKNDKNIKHNHKGLVNLIKSINSHSKIGIHPSYNSFLKEHQLSKEIKRLSEIINQKVLVSRFHYLRFQFPFSFQYLISCGVKKDYSMGYADRIGFRAGTCTPFYFYDLENETKTTLKVIPFAYMDGALKDKMSLSTQTAIIEIKAVKKTVQKVKGQFTAVWHNESLSNLDRWVGWRDVFEATWL